MTSFEGEGSAEFAEQNLSQLFQQFVDIAEASNGSFDTVLTPQRSIEIVFRPAGFLGMDGPGLEDEPDNLIDKIHIYIREHEDPRILVTQSYEVMVNDEIIPGMVEKDLEINGWAVDRFFRGVILGGSLSNTPLAELNDVNELPEHLRPREYAKPEDIQLDDPEDAMYLSITTEFEMTGSTINPGFLKKFGASDEIIATAEKIVEITKSKAHAFNEQDFGLLQECLAQLSS